MNKKMSTVAFYLSHYLKLSRYWYLTESQRKSKNPPKNSKNKRKKEQKTKRDTRKYFSLTGTDKYHERWGCPVNMIMQYSKCGPYDTVTGTPAERLAFMSRYCVFNGSRLTNVCAMQVTTLNGYICREARRGGRHHSSVNCLSVSSYKYILCIFFFALIGKSSSGVFN